MRYSLPCPRTKTLPCVRLVVLAVCLCWSGIGPVICMAAPDAVQAPDKSEDGPKWDYLVKTDTDLGGGLGLSEALTALGQEGWELCATTPTHWYSGNGGGNLGPPVKYIFKRIHKHT